MTTATLSNKRTGWRFLSYLARRAIMIDIPLSWDDIDSVTRRRDTLQSKQPRVSVDEDGGATLHLRMQNETNIEVQLKKADRDTAATGTRNDQQGQPVR